MYQNLCFLIHPHLNHVNLKVDKFIDKSKDRQRILYTNGQPAKYTQTNDQANGWPDRQINRQTDGKIEGRPDGWIDRDADKQTNK